MCVETHVSGEHQPLTPGMRVAQEAAEKFQFAIVAPDSHYSFKWSVPLYGDEPTDDVYHALVSQWFSLRHVFLTGASGRHVLVAPIRRSVSTGTELTLPTGLI